MITKCDECGGKVSDTAAACPHCGAPVKKPEQPNPCPECNDPLPIGATACPGCGAPATQPSPSPLKPHRAQPSASTKSNKRKRILLVVAGVPLGVVLVFGVIVGVSLYLRLQRANRTRDAFKARVSQIKQRLPGNLVQIPAGKTKSGSLVRTFFLDKRPVTEEEFCACVADGYCDGGDAWDGDETGFWVTMSYADSGRGRDLPFPGEKSSNEKFCKWAGKRLPTKEELMYVWEQVEGHEPELTRILEVQREFDFSVDNGCHQTKEQCRHYFRCASTVHDKSEPGPAPQ